MSTTLRRAINQTDTMQTWFRPPDINIAVMFHVDGFMFQLDELIDELMGVPKIISVRENNLGGTQLGHMIFRWTSCNHAFCM